MSLVVKLGALLFAVELPHTFSINLQLLGGVWILQLAPMLIGGLFTRWFHRWALLAGWLAGMVFGTIAAYNVSSATASHWAASSDIEFGHTIYIGLSAVMLNLVIAVVLTLVLGPPGCPRGPTRPCPSSTRPTRSRPPRPRRPPSGRRRSDKAEQRTVRTNALKAFYPERSAASTRTLPKSVTRAVTSGG